MIGPERHQPLDKPRLAEGGALEAGQRFGAIGLDDHIDRLRRFARGGFRRPHHVGLQLLGRSRLRGGSIGHLRLSRLSTLSSHLGIEGEQGLAELRRRPQRRMFEQGRIRPRQFSLDEAARVRGRAGEIAGCATARSEAEAVQGNQCTLRIARQLRFLFPPDSSGTKAT
jgi:hypothetical protein